MNIRKILLDVHMYLMIALSLTCIIGGIITNEWLFYLISFLTFEFAIVFAATSNYIDGEIDKVKKRVNELDHIITSKDNTIL